MKTKIFLLFIMLPFLSQATVWRVNGNPGIDADFTDLPDAVLAASGGDTIYVEPWVDGIYSTTTVDKPLTIIGGGYWLSQNDSTQYIDQWANINHLRFVTGSAGSKIAGVRFITQANYNAGSSTGRNVNGSVIIDDCCITVERCFSNASIALGLTSLADNCIIQNCYLYNFGQSLNAGGNIDVGSISLQTNPGLQGTGVQNTIIKNSVIGPVDARVLGNAETILSLSVSNCVIEWVDNDNVLTRNTTFSNNIFIGNTTQIAQTNVVFFNNFDVSNSIPEGNNNQVSVSFSSIFDPSTIGHPELRFKLAQNSPAIGAAIDGSDCGIFGGVEPYKLSGMPNIPSVFELSVSPEGNPNSQTLDVNLKAKSHD